MIYLFIYYYLMIFLMWVSFRRRLCGVSGGERGVSDGVRVWKRAWRENLKKKVGFLLFFQFFSFVLWLKRFHLYKDLTFILFCLFYDLKIFFFWVPTNLFDSFVRWVGFDWIIWKWFFFFFKAWEFLKY